MAIYVNNSLWSQSQTLCWLLHPLHLSLCSLFTCWVVLSFSLKSWGENQKRNINIKQHFDWSWAVNWTNPLRLISVKTQITEWTHAGIIWPVYRSLVKLKPTYLVKVELESDFYICLAHIYTIDIIVCACKSHFYNYLQMKIHLSKAMGLNKTIKGDTPTISLFHKNIQQSECEKYM